MYYFTASVSPASTQPVAIPRTPCLTWIGADIDDAAKEIVYRNYVDISVAVSSPNGLVVPVLRNVEDMGESSRRAGVTSVTAVMLGSVFSPRCYPCFEVRPRSCCEMMEWSRFGGGVVVPK